ncbi:MAG: FG-GAP-like repeat-containing protein [Planctomycetota bacterium]
MTLRRARLVSTFALVSGLLALTPSAPAAQIQGSFVERAAELGLDHLHVTGLDEIGISVAHDTLQSGVSLGDLDGDGDLDVVACGGVGTNSVFLNEGGTFVKAVDALGLEVGELDRVAALADFDGDGDLDVFLGALEGGAGPLPGRSRMYRNDGAAGFTEVTTLASTRGAGHSLFAQWADLDLDGLLDLYVSEFHGTRNLFYRNNGDGSFSELGAATGLDYGGATHVTAVVDADGDGLPDVFVANDYVVSQWTGLPLNIGDAHLHAQPDGTYVDVSAGSGYDHERGIMGLAAGDVDYDGDFDIYKSDVEENWLMVNEGWPGSGVAWSEQQTFYGVENDLVPDPTSPVETGRSVGWSTFFFNADFDPWIDLFLVNGRVAGVNASQQFSPANQPNYLFHSDGPAAQFTFTDRSVEAGFTEGIDDRGAAYGDVDRDGDLDLFVSPAYGALRYYDNQIERDGQGTLSVLPVCNTSAPGGFGVIARYTDSLGYPHLRLIGGDGPTASQHENRAFFALGDQPAIDLEVEFPSGVTLSFPQAPADSEVIAVEPELIRISARTLPIAPNPGVAGTRNQPTGTGPAGLYIVTAFAHDATGTPLGADAAVTIETPGLTALGGVIHIQGNEFRRYFTAPGAPGDFRTEVAFDGWTVGIRPRVRFFDPTDRTGTEIDVVPEAVRAASADEFTVIVAPKDANGVSLGSGDTVAIQIAGLAPLSGTADLGDGRYSATFPAPATPGVYPIDVAIHGALLSGLAEIEAGGIAVKSSSLLYQEKPYDFHSSAPHQLKLALTPRDATQLRLGPKAELVLTAQPDVGTPPVVVETGFFPEGQRDGQFVYVLSKPVGTPEGDATGRLQLLVDGVDLGFFPYVF